MLTPKQRELLIYIDKHLNETGCSPSFEEMKDALSLKSKSGIHRLISALEERGFLRRRHHRARALEVVRLPEDRVARTRADVSGHMLGVVPDSSDGGEDERDEVPNFAPNVIRGDFTGRFPGVRAAVEAAAVQLPLYGRIAAGLPIEALNETVAQIEVPVALIGGGDHYALEVAGDSMVDAGIFDGDTVIIRKSDVAENGQIVVALIDENEVTLKRLRRRGNSIALEPANARHETRIFPANRVQVQGRLIALMRRY
jgi:repressor LexA